MVDAKQKVVDLVDKINERDPRYLIVGLVILILAVDYFGVMQFQLGTLNSLNPKISELSQSLKSANSNIQRLPQFEKEVADFELKLAAVNDKIKSRAQVPMILENISLIADENNVKIEQIMPDTSDEEPVLKTTDGNYFSIPIILEAKSGFHQFGRFLNHLENEEVFLSFPDFTIAANGNEPTKHKVKLVIDAIIYEKAEKK